MGGWAWYGFILKLAGGDFLKIEEASKQNFIFALNHLAYMKSQENYLNAKSAENNRNKQTYK